MSADERDSTFVLLAHLVRSQGRHGELIADLLTDFPDRFSDRTAVWLLPPDARNAARAAIVERHWPHKGRIVLKFAGVDSITDASALTGWKVAVPQQQRVPLTDDAVYIADLIGCHVFDEATEGADLGSIVDVIRGEGDMLDMLVLHPIQTDQRPASPAEDELLIPFAKAYVISVDIEEHRICMRLPAGLTTINAPLTDEERAAQRRSREED